jgi:hypothetical protein
LSTFQLVRDLVLLFLGLLGAGLSLYNFFDIRRRSARILKLSLMTCMPTYKEGQLGNPLMEVIATNIGQRSVTVTNLGLELPEGRTLALLHQGYPGFEDTPTPATLQDGEIARRYFSYADIAGAVRQHQLPPKLAIKAFAVDSAGQRHYGKALSFDADQW